MSIMAIEDEKETKELAEICYRRTLGNPFFVMQFMAMLENEALVSYNQAKWAWNVDEIERHTKHTMDVVSLLQARMRKLPEDAQLLLQYAACLGTSFSFSTIVSFPDRLPTAHRLPDHLCIVPMLKRATRIGYHMAATWCRWCW